MTQENYVSEYTQDLARRSQQNTGDVPVIDLTNWQSPRYIPGNSQTRSLTSPATLSNACHSIEIKNTIDGVTDKCPILVESSIITCTSPVILDCPADTAAQCPVNGTVSTGAFINMLAIFDMGASQGSVKVTFKYVMNGTPMQITRTVPVTLGINRVYAYDTNHTYPADTILVLYGAEVLA